MKTISIDDALEWVVNELTRKYGGAHLDQQVAIDQAMGGCTFRDEQRIRELFTECASLGYLKVGVQGNQPTYALTQRGMERVHEVDTLREIEDQLPRLERWLRRKTKAWDLTWNTVVQGVTLAIALAGLIVAVLK